MLIISLVWKQPVQVEHKLFGSYTFCIYEFVLYSNDGAKVQRARAAYLVERGMDVAPGSAICVGIRITLETHT